MISRPPTSGAAARFSADGAGSLSQERLLVMLYERLQRDLHTAIDAITAGDREASHRALLHAQEILAELDGALDRDVWDGADQLSAVYRFLMDRLVVANVRQDVASVRDCLRVVDPLVATWTDAWTAVSSAPRAVPAPAPNAAAPIGAVVHDELGIPRPTPSLDVVG